MNRTSKPKWMVCLVVVLLAAFATACGDDDGDGGEAATTVAAGATDTAGSGTQTETETVTLQLDWVPNTNHTGFFVADQLGYYEEAGIELEILPYSGSNADTLVAEGTADFGISFQNSITLSRPAGVPVVAVAAILQHTAEAIAVRADRDDLASPKDLDGQTYAGFGGAFEVPVLTAIIQADGGKGEFETVVLDTAAYEALYSDRVDFAIPFVTWEGIEAELNNEPLKYFVYSDYGLPDHYSVIIVAAPDWLAGNQDLASRFLQATQRGFEYGAENPAEAGQILIDANPGVFTQPELVMRSQELMAEEYFLDEDGRWGIINDEKFAAYSQFLYDAGIVVDQGGNKLPEAPDWNEFHDMSYLSPG